MCICRRGRYVGMENGRGKVRGVKRVWLGYAKGVSPTGTGILTRAEAKYVVP